MNIVLVSNTCYIILWEFLHKNKSVKVFKTRAETNIVNIRILVVLLGTQLHNTIIGYL